MDESIFKITNESDLPKGYLKALKSAFNILDFADNSEKKLREKLARKGNDRDSIDYACEYLKRIGYLDEARSVRSLVEMYAYSRLYGKVRIVNELYKKGYSRDIIDDIDWDEIDFATNCAKRRAQMASRYPDPQKMYAALRRYGFTNRDIQEARDIEV